MKKIKLLTVCFFALLAMIDVSAQSKTEIEAAKAMAEAYGYSESEIETLLSGKDENKEGSKDKISLPSTTEKENDSFTIVEPASEDSTARKNNEIYGHKFFASKGFGIIPSLNTPAPDNYVLGPGDEVAVDVWGGANAKINGILAKDGTIMINGVGPVRLGGLTVKKAEAQLRNSLSTIYGGIGDDTRLRLSIGKVKSMTVNVVGDVLVPGPYSLPALSAITSAIFMAGGVEETASVRNIRLYRDGKLAATFDLYDFIFNGTYSNDLKLQDGDVVSVPSHCAIATIEGEVKRPMRYEMKPGETLKDLIAYAGGFTEDAVTDNVYLERKDQARGYSFDVMKSEFGTACIQGGDLVAVRKNNPIFENRVKIGGAVIKPGQYSIGGKIQTAKDLVEAAGGLSEAALKDRAVIFRKDKDMVDCSVNIDIKKVMDGTENVILVREDSLHVYTASEIRDTTYVKIYGEIQEEGEILWRPGMTIADAIIEAGGIKPGANLSNVEVASKGHDKKGSIKLYDLVKNPEQAATELNTEDYVFIRRYTYFREQQTIKINGEVTYPGTYVIDKGTVRLSDIVERAGGFTPDAYVHGARLKRTLTKAEKARMEVALDIASQLKSKKDFNRQQLDSLKEEKIKDTYTIGIDLEQALKHPGSDIDVVLRTGDVISVPVMDNTVKITGAVFYPNVVVFNPSFSCRDYINQAGGKLRGTKNNKIYAVYMNGMVAKKGSPQFVMEPGMELVVTKEDKPQSRMSVAEIAAITSSSTSIAYMMTSLVRMFF